MPIYEYACEACGHEMEAMQKMSDDPLKACPSCGEERLKKLISASGFRLKGSGWYVTDFKGGDNKGSGNSEKSTKAAPATSNTGKSSASSD